MGDVEEIVRRLGPRQLAAWKACEWEGEYYSPPNLPVWERRGMRFHGLLDDEGCVTILGERLIAHLNRPSKWRRCLLRVREHLLSSKEGE